MSQYDYMGKELDLFAKAVNWKDYMFSIAGSYIRGNVLEVGAGIGGNTVRLLQQVKYTKWLCVEPDSALCEILAGSVRSNSLANCDIQCGTIHNLNGNDRFDTILYFDVMEHIDDDKAELLFASRHLTDNGRIIVAGPAHNCLYSKFDESIGHVRRYNKSMLASAVPDTLEIVRFMYLDSAGLLASLMNKLLLKQSMPTLRQVEIWDRKLVPVSRKLDPVLGYSFGKSFMLIAGRSYNKKTGYNVSTF